VGRLTIFQDYLGLRPIYPDKLIRVRVDESKASPAFIRLAGDSDLVRAEVERLCATTVGNWGISATNLKSVRFPLPQLDEQQRIVAKVERLTSICDQLEDSITTGDIVRNRLLDAVLRDALASSDLQAA
jgi:type I restriction enzyme S subunit